VPADAGGFGSVHGAAAFICAVKRSSRPARCWAEATGGLAFTGLQQANVQNLADLAAAYAEFTGMPAASFASWPDTTAALLAAGDRHGRRSRSCWTIFLTSWSRHRSRHPLCSGR